MTCPLQLLKLKRPKNENRNFTIHITNPTRDLLINQKKKVPKKLLKRLNLRKLRITLLRLKKLNLKKLSLKKLNLKK